jgi:outer membrane PBP1 activator LpoA protein
MNNATPEKKFKLTGFKNPIPKQEDIDRVIAKIEERLTVKQINMAKNYGVKEGYERLIKNLKENTNDFSQLKTIQGRAIASLADDYRQGMCSEDVICNVPIQMR